MAPLLTPLQCASCASAFIASLTLFNVFRINRVKKTALLAGLALLCICAADSLSTLSYQYPEHEVLLAFKASELLYLGFICLVSAFVLIRFEFSVFASKSDQVLFACILLLYGAINYVYILHPFLTRPATPDAFNIAVSTAYAIVCSMLFSLLLMEGFKTNNFCQCVLMHAFLLLSITDFAIRYKTAFPTANISAWFDNLWYICVCLIAWLFILYNRQILDQDTESVGFFSLRGIYAASMLAGFLVYGLLLNIVGVYKLNDISLVINIMITGFFIWATTNIISLHISKSISQANARLLSSWSGIVDAAPNGEVQFIETTAQTRISEFKGLVDSYNRLSKVANELLADRVRAAKILALSHIAAQVAHDIRSPLAALDSVLKSTWNLPEEQRIMVRHAVNRIRDIANNLLEKNRQQDKEATDSAAGGHHNVQNLMEVRLLSSVLDPVVTEKRLQFESKPGVNIDFELTQEAYGLFARIQPVEFKRVISNLINNAVEALGDGGSVDLKMLNDNGNILLTVSDNGKGIPPEILAKLGQRGETYGKTGGSGLGLFHAKSAVENWGGSLAIASTLGKCTTVTIKLPAAEAPAGFVSVLELAAGMPVVVLDDDISIHQVWQGRFDSARVKESDIEIIHFSEPGKLREWVTKFPEKANRALYLFDYELLNYKETGLSLASELDLASKVILVTSRYEERGVIEESTRLGIRMIPKGLAGFVPIVIKSPPSGSKTAVLIDDDALVHMTWKVAARSAGVALQPFKHPADFFATCKTLSKDTPIYIDSDLGEGQKGEEIAKTIYEKGFKTIYLETGHPPDSFPKMPWIKEVISKEPPWSA
jgi:signal transduction histidine kinase